MGGMLHLVQRGGDWAGQQSLLSSHAVPNVTAHLSKTSVPITLLLYFLYFVFILYFYFTTFVVGIKIPK